MYFLNIHYYFIGIVELNIQHQSTSGKLKENAELLFLSLANGQDCSYFQYNNIKYIYNNTNFFGNLIFPFLQVTKAL